MKHITRVFQILRKVRLRLLLQHPQEGDTNSDIVQKALNSYCNLVFENFEISILIYLK